MPIKTFHPLSTELTTGISLIEASAGTGKTYAIAMLVLRFVVEKGVNIEQLLVVTFTTAATEELKARIRARLSEAKQLMAGHQLHQAKNMVEWLNSLRLTPDLIKQRLESALLNIDQAAIFTIHGFCQRTLTEYALESGQLFKFELIIDSPAMKQRCADDYWRKQLYPRTALQVALLTAFYTTPERLLQSVTSVALSAKVLPECADLNPLLHTLEQLINQAALQFEHLYQNLKIAFAEDKFKKNYVDTFEEQANTLKFWLMGECLALPPPESLYLFSDQGLDQALNGSKFRKTKAQTGEQRKSDYIESLTLDNTVFNQITQAIRNITLQFRLGLIKELRTSIQAYLQPLNQFTVNDLIAHLASALANDTQQQLTQALQQRFHVALIDEFQDTDTLQWTIFSQLFSTAEHAMYLIGDPKQAIYKFRGADIFAYFTAKNNVEHHFTLDYNWRAHPHLVAAVNQLFSRNQPFLFEKLAFHKIKPALTVNAGEICYQHQAIAPMMLWQLAKSDSKTGDWTGGKAASVIQIAVINEIVALLTTDYSLKSKQQWLQLAPKSIAILVKSNQQARDYQQALQQRGVPAVINSKQSVFSSPQAFELYQLLQAIAQIADISRLKQALTLDWFGLQGQYFYQLMNDETALNSWISRFNTYHLLWQQQGLMLMMTRLLAQEKVHQHLSVLPLAERMLTNLHHLIELLEQTATEQQLGIQQTLTYLANTIQQDNRTDEQLLRLESDDQAVKIVTLHGSKGLEYDIIFCPFLWQSPGHLIQEDALVNCHIDGEMICDLGSSAVASHQLIASKEQLAEDLRIVYVALTRAKYRCYLTWANVRSQSTPNASALAYLMDFSADNFDVQQQKLKKFSDQHQDVFAYQLIQPTLALQGYYQAHQPLVQVEVKLPRRRFLSHWKISSYTALATSSNQALAENNPTIATQANLQTQALPKGSQTGQVIHSLLEFNSFNKLADTDTDLSQQRDQTCLRYGLSLEQPEVIDQLLHTVVSTPLSLTDQNFCLKNINHWHCIKEMPFYLAVKLCKVQQINDLLKNCPSYRPLNPQQLEGYLTGFIDLICLYNGRYYLMDYKSNYLPDYEIDSLIVAMREHNYGLQYWLYCCVLHLYLQNRLPHYSYKQHFGGVRYLFLRGMIAEQALSGVYTCRPDLETLNGLVSIFV
jgi:exodeoxyribonuclease V beta subunit